jgi:hypothetical protein
MGTASSQQSKGSLKSVAEQSKEMSIAPHTRLCFNTTILPRLPGHSLTQHHRSVDRLPVISEAPTLNCMQVALSATAPIVQRDGLHAHRERCSSFAQNTGPWSWLPLRVDGIDRCPCAVLCGADRCPLRGRGE